MVQLTVKLQDKTMHELERQARARGESIDVLAAQFLEQRLHLDATLAPIYDAVEALGVTDDQADALFEEARDDHFADRMKKASANG
ncbi:MAG: hypothetical protein AAGK78_05465 [Planctomycetota bacterium]